MKENMEGQQGRVGVEADALTPALSQGEREQALRMFV
jgi:hypothetical protein